MNFTFFYIQTHHITGIGPYIIGNIKDDSLVTITNGAVKLIEGFGNLWPACTKGLTPFSRKNLADYPGLPFLNVNLRHFKLRPFKLGTPYGELCFFVELSAIYTGSFN